MDLAIRVALTLMIYVVAIDYKNKYRNFKIRPVNYLIGGLAFGVWAFAFLLGKYFAYTKGFFRRY